MSTEFEPFEMALKKNEFNALEYDDAKVDEEPVISAEEQFIDQCEQLKLEATERGYAEGIAQAQSEIDTKKQELAAWINLLGRPVQLLDDKLTQELIQTLIWLCKNCIGVELSVHPEKLAALFEAIKPELLSMKAAKVFAMHPDDLAWMQQEMTELLPGMNELLTADPELSRGDFYIRGDHSELDGRLDTRFASVFAKYIDKTALNTPTPAEE